MDAYQTVLARRSVRKYKPDPVPRDLLEKVLDAGRLAPTGRNEQPWAFVVVTDAAKRRELAGLCENGKFLAEAPACIVVLSAPAKYYLEDGSAATTQMMIAARALGLATCWIAGDKKAYAAQVAAAVGTPADHLLVALIAVGYAAETPHPPKRSFAEVVHWERFGGPR